jgi:TM2 domain-containing membrane protein YozV
MTTPRNSQELRETILRMLLTEIYKDGQIDNTEKEFVRQVFPHLGITMSRFNEIRDEVMRTTKVNPAAGTLDLGRFVPEIAYLLIKSYSPESAEKVQKNMQRIFNLDPLFLRACVENATRRLNEENEKINREKPLLFEEPVIPENRTAESSSASSLLIKPGSGTPEKKSFNEPVNEPIKHRRKITRRRYGKRMEQKNTTTAFLLWFFLGSLGGHRFYLGKNGTAFIYICLTLVGFFPIVWIMWIIDGLSLSSEIQKFNHECLPAPGKALPANHSNNNDDFYEEIIEEESGFYETAQSGQRYRAEIMEEPEHKDSIEKRLLELAEKEPMHQLTLKDAIKAGISISEAKAALLRLEEEGLCEKSEINGSIYYCFNNDL